MREDYNHDGNAWDYFSHDQSRSRAYRWGEDEATGPAKHWPFDQHEPGVRSA